MKHVREMDPIRRELMVIMATMHNVEMEGMRAGVAECWRMIDTIRARHPEIVDAYFRELEEAEKRRSPEALAAIEAMLNAPNG